MTTTPTQKRLILKNLIVLFSGAFFNFVSAILVAIVCFAAYGETVAKVNTVYDYAPTVNRQLRQNDIIYKINGKRVYMLDNLSRYMSDEMDIVVLRPREENGAVVYEEVTVEGVQQRTFFTSVLTKVEADYVENGRKLQVGDTVYRLDGEYPDAKGELAELLSRAGDTVLLTVTDGSDYYTYTVQSKDFFGAITAEEQPYTGIGMSVSYVKHNFGFGEVLLRVVPYCCEVGMLVLRTLGGLLTGSVGLEAVGGPITTISMTSEIVATGFANVLLLIVLISVNLAVFNLLPVPALDGCQMVFVIIEWIAGKPINRKVQGYINGIGLVVLIALMLLIDILKL